MADMDHPPVTARTRWVLTLLLAPLLAATVVGAVLLWPSGSGVSLRPAGTQSAATVTAVRTVACADSVSPMDVDCTRIEVRLHGSGRVALQDQPAENVTGVKVGAEVTVARTTAKTGEVTYRLEGRRRSGPLLALTAAAALLLLVLARQRALLLVAAFAISAVIVTAFAVPSVLDGRSPLAVSVVGAALVATAVLFGGRGVNARTSTALFGSLLAIGGAGLVGQAVVEAAHLAGLGRDRPPYLHLASGTVPTAGLLLAGLVLGTVGALIDLTLRQVDATWDLRGTDVSAGWRGVTAAGLRRGRGHLPDVAATVVLAYAGAALPVLVLLSSGDRSVLGAVGGDVVGVEVARALVGIVALAASVPITAALAAVVVVREGRVKVESDPRRFRSRHERQIWDATGLSDR